LYQGKFAGSAGNSYQFHFGLSDAVFYVYTVLTPKSRQIQVPTIDQVEKSLLVISSDLLLK